MTEPHASVEAEERERILDLLHRELPYPTEACAIIRAAAIRDHRTKGRGDVS